MIFQSGVAPIALLFPELFLLFFLFNHGGSLSSHVNISCGLKLAGVLRIVLLKILTFSMTLVFEKTLALLNSLIAPRIISLAFF